MFGKKYPVAKLNQVALASKTYFCNSNSLGSTFYTKVVKQYLQYDSWSNLPVAGLF